MIALVNQPTEDEKIKKALTYAMRPDGGFAKGLGSTLRSTYPWLGAEAAENITRDFVNRQAAGFESEKARPQPGLSKEKTQALVNSLAQPEFDPKTHKMSADAVIHLYFNAEIQRDLHATLDRAFDPKGPLAVALATDMIAAGQGLQPQVIAKAATDFMTDRQVAAHNVAEAMKQDSEVVKTAAALAEGIRAGDLPLAQRVRDASDKSKTAGPTLAM